MNKPKHQIGDRLSSNGGIPGTSIYVRGLMTTSQGKHIYFWQMGDNSLVVSEEQIEGMLDISLVQSA